MNTFNYIRLESDKKIDKSENDNSQNVQRVLYCTYYKIK